MSQDLINSWIINKELKSSNEIDKFFLDEIKKNNKNNEFLNNNLDNIKKIVKIFSSSPWTTQKEIMNKLKINRENLINLNLFISNSKNITRVNQNGQETTNRVYTFRVHVINRDIEDVVSLYELPIKDANYLLKLYWENEHSVSYKLSNGKKHNIDLRKYAPKLF